MDDSATIRKMVRSSLQTIAGADFTEADLAGTLLRGARGLEQAKGLERAENLEKAVR